MATQSDSDEVRHGNENKYFDVVIKPMLTPGHEGELIEWMKDMGLIKQAVRCPCAGQRGKMVWSKARIVDKYTWVCRACSKKLSIRSESFFAGFKCDLKKVMLAILCWCNRVSGEVAAKQLDLRLTVVFRIYDSLSQVASNYVKAHSDEWKLGGENVVVLVDVYPDGYMSTVPRSMEVGRRRSTNKKRILCIAEISQIPSRIWVKILEEVSSNSKDSPEVTQRAVQEALHEITEHVLPGSILLANERSAVCPFSAVRTLKDFPMVHSVEHLKELNVPGTRAVEENLETIWQSVVDVCDESQEVRKSVGSLLLDEFLWRQLISQTTSSKVESILHQIAEQYSERWRQRRHNTA
ncbi:uncharacterized protein [Anabrus simplex]|uniref:uncharacterized protein n=1 Tax=Anabrus simplex TaxID=316456 RepID=UPI0034DCCCB4